MAVAFLTATRGINLDSSVTTLTVPFSLTATANKAAVVHIAVLSAVVTVLNVTDNATTPNVYTFQAGVNASYTPGNRTFGGAAAGFPGGDSDFNWPADIQTTADQLTQGQVRGEVWTSPAAVTPGAATQLIITLSGGAKCAAEVLIYTGVGSYGAITAANAVAVTSSSAPTIAVTTGATASYLSAGFASQSCLNQAALPITTSGPILTSNVNTVRSEISGGTSDRPLSMTAADSTGVTAAVVGISPVNTESTDISISSGTQNAKLIPVPATYAVCAVEVHG